jgi:hypothetical protein
MMFIQSPLVDLLTHANSTYFSKTPNNQMWLSFWSLRIWPMKTKWTLAEMDRFLFQELKRNCSDAVSLFIIPKVDLWHFMSHTFYITGYSLLCHHLSVSSFICAWHCSITFYQYLFKRTILIYHLTQSFSWNMHVYTCLCSSVCFIFTIHLLYKLARQTDKNTVFNQQSTEYRVNTSYSVQFTANSAQLSV